MDETKDEAGIAAFDSTELKRFAESYDSFNRIINSLQRQYIELKDEFSQQNAQLAETNRQLVEMTGRNLAATEFLNSIVTSVSVGIIAVNRLGVITHFNRAASLMFGLLPQEALGKPYRELIPPGYPVEANALRAAESGRSVESVEKQLELANGARLLVSVSTAILRDKDGRAQGAVEVLHDLTRIKKMEQKITRLTTLAALGEMAATIAHEVRNPLAGIGGFASLLKRDIPVDDPKQKLADKIISGVETLNQIVTSLLNYTRFEVLNEEDVLFAPFLQSTVEQFCEENAEAVASISIEFEADESVNETHSVCMDQLLVRQVLFNLLLNAVEAAGSTGQIQITCRRLTRKEALPQYAERLMLALDETVIETIITDSGRGIPQEHLDKIFTPFFTTKQNGTGLGLAVSWKIAKAHGGEIIAQNLPSGGARFVLILRTKIDTVDMEQTV